MLVANSFDLWQKDAFFSAAEEVQESADIMESVYRAWVSEKRERSNPEELDELSREVQTALGTAKWQLEEFEKAVSLSYIHLGCDTASTRHRQFISAIKSQISCVEAALRASYAEEGRPPLRWVNLDEEERDDLAAFLSGSPQTMQSAKDQLTQVTSSLKSSVQEKQLNEKNRDFNIDASCRENICSSEVTKNVIAIMKDANCIIEIKEDAVSRTSDVVSQAVRTANTKRTWSSPNFESLRIVIADEDEHRNKHMRTVEVSPKEKGFKPAFWKQKCEEYPQAMRAVHMFNQLFCQISWFQRQGQSPLRLQHGCSVRVTLALMLTIFIIGMLSVSRSQETIIYQIR